MARYFIGIDPGLQGAIAFIDVDNQRLHTCPTPVYVEKVRGKKKTMYDVPAMARLLSLPAELVSMVYIEHVSAMPGQGVTSMFRFGFGYGLWIGMLGACRFPYKTLTPRSWKPKYDLGSDKEMSRQVASTIFPLCTNFWRLKKHDGLAEASLLAHRSALDANYTLNNVCPMPEFGTKQILLG